jgi:hypothetical protein
VLEACRQHHGLVVRADMVGWRLLYCACIGGHLELARGLLDLGAVVDARAIHGYDALMCASRFGHAAVVTLLLDRGADPCSRNDRFSALYMAAKYNHLQVCLILLNRGADLMAVCQYGPTALTHYGIGANSPLSNEIKEQRREQLRVAHASTQVGACEVCLSRGVVTGETWRRWLAGAVVARHGAAAGRAHGG